jgi:hypothetical protein
MSTIAESISRVRNTVKAAKEDAFMTDRYIYSLIYKYGKTLMRRQDTLKKLMSLHNLFTTLPCLNLIEVDKIEACCGDIKSGCKIMRTEEKVPKIMQGTSGPLIRSVTSIDGSIEVYETKPSLYTSMTKSTNFKYNKNKYYWYVNDYLYFPNIEWESIKLEAIFEGDYSQFLCDEKEQCVLRQNQTSPFPEHFFSEIESLIKQELSLTMQIPAQENHDKQNLIR